MRKVWSVLFLTAVYLMPLGVWAQECSDEAIRSLASLSAKVESFGTKANAFNQKWDVKLETKSEHAAFCLSSAKKEAAKIGKEGYRLYDDIAYFAKDQMDSCLTTAQSVMYQVESGVRSMIDKIRVCDQKQ